MVIPNKIKIGWREYNIKQAESKLNANGNELLGEICYEKHEIYLNNNYTIDEMKLTLIHEIIHGIFHKQHQDEYCNNENLINAISEGLFELILDNPLLFKEGE